MFTNYKRECKILKKTLKINKKPKNKILCIEFIEAIKAEDLHRVSQKMLSSKPSVAAIGNLERFPGYEGVERGLYKSPKSFGRYLFGQ